MVVVIFGVSAAGKTTVGKLVAEKLGWQFYDADDFHPQSNIDKMRHGIPLTDEDRWPWLKKMREQIERSILENENAVLACSALKKQYRGRLRVDANVQFVFLDVGRDRVAHQMRERRGHFMNPDLIESQFADLERPAPGEAIIVKVKGTPEITAAEIISRIDRLKQARG